MTNTTARKRLQRFERPTERLPLLLTQRDIYIIRLVALFRLLRSDQIQEIVDGSDQQILRRLQRLWAAGYLDRPRNQTEYYVAGSLPLVYALGDLGARFLNRTDAANFPEGNGRWRQKNKSVTNPFIKHTIAIADVHVAILRGVRERIGTALIDANALIARFPSAPAKRERAFQWTGRVTHEGATYTVSANPDYVFALATREIAMRAYIVEVDRGTMTIETDDFNQSSILRKFLAQVQGLRDKRHEQQFGWKAMRILYVAPSPARADNMRVALAAYCPDPHIRRQFYFTSADALDNVLGAVWIDGNGQLQSLI